MATVLGQRAPAYLGVDDAFPIDDLDEILPGLIEGTQRIYYSMGHDDVFDQRVMGWVKNLSDEDYYPSAYGGGNGPYVRTWGMPRTYGVTVSYFIGQ